MRSGPQVLLDADAFAKLAHWGLLDELPTLFGCGWSQICTLPSVKHRALRVIAGKTDRLFVDAASAQRAVDALERMGTMAAPDPQVIASLQGVAQIDAGEAVLFASVGDAGQIVTGDKRALVALASGVVPMLHSRLNGRIVCLERVLLALLDHLGMAELRGRIRLYRTIDKVTVAVLGSTGQAPESSVREGLASYIADIERQCALLSATVGILR